MRDDTKETIDNYVKNRWQPGGFITAVLANDLMEAFGRADYGNRNDMFEIVTYIYNAVPRGAWGSYEVVNRWLTEDKNENNI